MLTDAIVYPNGDVGEKTGEHFWMFAPWAVPMQYTGLKDKKGKEIYFDDILQISFADGAHEEWDGTALVTHTMNGGAGVLYDTNADTSRLPTVHAVSHGGEIQDLWEDDELWTLEIIGNIYENPNLLTNEK